MNMKKLLPATIASILLGGMGLAQADVQVKGHIDQSVVNYDIDGARDDDGIRDPNDSDTNFVCTTCSIGFKGSEDLGNGLQAIFWIDFQYDMNNRNTATSTIDRDQWLGLKGSNWGQVRVGTISTPYKSHGAAIDPMYRTSVQARSRGLQSNFHLGAGEELQGRATNTARYDSPSWNGLKGAVFFTLDSTDTSADDDNPYGAGISYENGGILVFGDYMSNNGGNTQGDITAWKVGGKYTLNNFSIFGQYEDSDEDSNLAAAEGLRVWHVGGTYTMGNNTLYAAYGQGTADFNGGGFDDEDYTTWSVGGIHKLSKRTLIYAAYTAADCDANMNNIFANGMDVSVCASIDDGTDSVGQGGSSGLGGGDNVAATIGMKHKF